MTLIQLVTFLKTTLNTTKIYPLQFPINNTDESVFVVEIHNGDMSAGGMKEINFQLVYRSKHPSTAETLASNHIPLLHNLTNKIQDTWQVVLVQCSDTNPELLGQDDETNYVYTVSYRLLTSQ